MNKVGIALLAMIVFSCSKKTEEITPPCLVTKITQMISTASAPTVTTFEYNDENLISKIVVSIAPSYTRTTVFAYSSGVVSTSTVDSNPPGVWTHEGGRVKKVVDGSTTHDFSYDANNNLTNFHRTDDVGEYDLSTTYGGDGNPISAVAHITIPSGEITANFAFSGYDQKKNPYTLLAKALNQPIYFDGSSVEYYYIFKNNPGASDQTSTCCLPVNDTYSYQYNTDGYVTTSIVTETSGQYAITTQFEYKNCD